MSKKKFIFYTVLILVAVFFLILGGIVNTGDKISKMSSILGICFYVLAVILFFILLVRPLLKIALTPSLKGSPIQEIGNMSYSEYSKYLKSLNLSIEESTAVNCSTDGIQTLSEILKQRSVTLEEEVRKTASEVFLITSVSQNGVLDFVSSLYFNFRLIKRIVEKSGRRPSFVQLVRLYFSIVTTSMIITGVDQLLDDVDLSEITGVVGIKFFGTLFQSVLNGAANALSCLRVGYATIEYLENGESEYKANTSYYHKKSFGKAKKALLDILKSSPMKMKQYFQTMRNDGNSAGQTDLAKESV